jgi:hypothetical protein
MSTTDTAHGISNGHWERHESRSAWLLLLARMGIVELRALGELARAATAHDGAHHPPQLAHVDEHEPIAAE